MQHIIGMQRIQKSNIQKMKKKFSIKFKEFSNALNNPSSCPIYSPTEY